MAIDTFMAYVGVYPNVAEPRPTTIAVKTLHTRPT